MHGPRRGGCWDRPTKPTSTKHPPAPTTSPINRAQDPPRPPSAPTRADYQRRCRHSPSDATGQTTNCQPALCCVVMWDGKGGRGARLSESRPRHEPDRSIYLMTPLTFASTDSIAPFPHTPKFPNSHTKACSRFHSATFVRRPLLLARRATAAAGPLRNPQPSTSRVLLTTTPIEPIKQAFPWMSPPPARPPRRD